MQALSPQDEDGLRARQREPPPSAAAPPLDNGVLSASLGAAGEVAVFVTE